MDSSERKDATLDGNNAGKHNILWSLILISVWKLDLWKIIILKNGQYSIN